MSYFTQAKLAGDADVQLRVAACAANEGIDNPQGWAAMRSWELSAQPGWDAAYASAIAAGSEAPGADEAAITDGMILSAVQGLRAGEADE